MGRTPLPEVSFRTTTGMFVTGSIIKPRIFTSSSMVASPGLGDVLAGKTVRASARNLHLHVFSQKIHVRRSKIYQTIAGGSPAPLRTRGMAAVHQHFIGLPHQLFVSRELDRALPFVQNREATGLFLLGNRVRHVHRRSVGPRRI